MIASIFAAAALMALPATASAAQFGGPFELRQALTFYVVNPDGADFSIAVHWQNQRQAAMDQPVLVRVFDPQERMIVRHDDPGRRCDGTAPQHTIDLPIPCEGRPGVYQVAVTGMGGTVSLETKPELRWGVFGYPWLGASAADALANSYIYVPPGLERMTIRSEGADKVELFDEHGKVVPGSGVPAAITAALPRSGEHIWKLLINAAGPHRLSFGGMPIILCPDPDTARAIHASVDVLDDGTICFHKFQIRAHELLKQYRAMEPGAFDVRVPELGSHKGQWLQSPARNLLLLQGAYGVFSVLPAVLHEQNLQRDSPWFGTIRVWREAAGARSAGARQGNPWTTYDRLNLSRVIEHAGVLAAVYSVDEPFNPLHRDPALLNRIIIAELQQLMMIREHELPQSEFTEFDGGDRVFAFESILRPFPLVVDDCPAEVRDVWTEGLRRYVDRQSIGELATVVNQWTFLICGLQSFADGTGEEAYANAAQRHVDWILSRSIWGLGFHPAGYFAESSGPDATYNGITLHNLAWVYHRTKNPELLEAIRKSIDLFNHTVAPEPRKRLREPAMWLGASNFNHRTPGDWTTTQFGGGLGMLADDLAEASPHLGRAWLTSATVDAENSSRAAEQDLLARFYYLGADAFDDANVGPDRIAGASHIAFQNWQYFPPSVKPGDLPMLAHDRFACNFGDEFFCVRRPAYYAFIYAGTPMDDIAKAHRPGTPRKQHVFNGGGLSMFWSEGFGSSILAKNWSAYAAHSIIAEHAAGAVYWDDYFAVQSTFDEQNATAKITGSLLTQPLAYARDYAFLEDRIDCTLTLTAQQAMDFARVWECFPYPLDKSLPLHVRFIDERGQPVDGVSRPARAVVFQSEAREAHVIVFDRPRICQSGVDEGVDVLQATRKHGRVLAALPSRWGPGQTFTLRWSIKAVPADRVGSAVRELIRAMPAE